MSDRLRLAVLISGSGSNLKALIEAVADGTLAVEITQVISNRAEAGGLEHARRAGIPCSVIDRALAERSGVDEDRLVAQCLRTVKPDLVLLSGYMRIIGTALVDEFAGRMINQHPSLLPRYKGLNTYARVLEAGDGTHGASVHFVTAELDGGPVIAQVQLSVQPEDTPHSLARRLAPREHQLLLAVVEAFSQGRITLRQGLVWCDQKALQQPLMLRNGNLEP